MEFSNLCFLYIWLPFVLIGYFLVRQMRWRNYLLAGFSLLFYAMGQPVYLVLLVALTYANFRLAAKIVADDRRTLMKPVVLNIAVLALFKYLDFFLGIIGIRVENGLLMTVAAWLIGGLNAIGFHLEVPASVIPVGISFYTFSVISYLVDIYRGRVEPESDFKKLLLYVTMFPKMVQGPIVRYEQIDFQLAHRRMEPGHRFEGGLRFAMGLAKKVLLADYCGKVIAEMTALEAQTSFVGAWLAAVLFMFQIYFDFSGCSDMAIGLGRVFGFTFCENFDQPYLSRSITEFWRRWHMSLGSFFRDYVYIPLGGNRMGLKRQMLNLLAVWTLTGLWHGASWNYVLWVLYFFALLAVEKKFATQIETLPNALRHVLTLLLLLFGWVLFANEDFAALGAAFGGMFGFGGFCGTGAGIKLLNSLPLLLVCTLGCTALPHRAAAYWRGWCGMNEEDEVTPRKTAFVASEFLLMILLLWLCTVSLVGSTSAPSIYGNF